MTSSITRCGPLALRALMVLADIDDHVVVLDHADLVVVKTKNLQFNLLPGQISAYLCDNGNGLSN